MKIFPAICLLVFAFATSFAQSFQNIEAVEYDPGQNRFLVSNGSSIIQRNADGSLEYFGNGATASYGMEVMNNILFAIDNGIKGYDLNSGELVMSLSIPGAGFLNGLASNDAGFLYATDFSASKIYSINVADLDNPVVNTIVENTGSTPNGITYDSDNNRLVFVNWGNNADIKAVNLFNLEVTVLTGTALGNIDGIDIDNQGNFYVASWSPDRISKYDNSFSTAPETITVAGLDNPADICYANAIDTLAIPNTGSETVVFVGFDVVSEISIPKESFSFTVFPNPVADQSVISYVLTQPEFVRIEIFDLDGKLVAKLMDEKMMTGKHHVFMHDLNLEHGAYFIKMTKGEQVFSKKIIR